jgi:outer membrane protein OmpA-like peptidoglycan-associated protein
MYTRLDFESNIYSRRNIMKLTYCNKNLLALIALLFIGMGSSLAQNAEQKNGFGVFYGNQKYAGNAGNEYSRLSDSDFMAGISYSRYLSKTFDLGFAFSFARLDHYDSNYNGRPYFYMNEMYNSNAQLKAKLFSEDALVRPYLLAGIGYNYNDVLRGRNSANTREKFGTPNIPVGGGFKIKLDDRVTFDIETTWNKVLGNFDFASSSSGPDAFMYHTIGLNYTFGPKPTDTDGDGVPDYRDRCPDTPRGVQVDEFGCPKDNDADGVPDYMDRCPTVPGLEKFDGCPDRDGDGIEDAFDKCPDVPGVAEFFGCPDRDGDGIPDSADKCADVAGLCQFDGCPDRDGDGVPDYMDECPDEPGTVANKGCPEIKKDDIDAINAMLDKVYFDFDKFEVKSESFDALNKIVNILSENPSYKVLIEAHADNIGSDSYNNRLSARRGDAVKNYLISNGINESRLSSQAYGKARPAASNSTAQGRALNRRVEFTVSL